MKQMHIVRYADDFKIFCKDYETASKIKIAVCKWLKERLNLEVSKKKTKITNLKSSYSKFLGIKFKVFQRANKYIVKSRITKETKSRLAYKLKKQIKVIQKENTQKQIAKLNSMILGMQNYYSMATLVSHDFREIAFKVNRALENRLWASLSEKGNESNLYKKLYSEYNSKPYYVAGLRIFPISAVKTDPPMNFSQEICDYTVKGRKKIHKRLKNVSPYILNYLVENPIKGETIEYNDNRISRYSGQNGCCYITGKPLLIGDIECHHKKPRCKGGKDNYRNLILISKNIHKLIHAKNQETIQKYLNKVNKMYFDDKALSKLNKFRSKVGNECIKIV